MTSLLLFLLGTLAAADPDAVRPASADPGALRPASVLQPEGSPLVVHLAAPVSPAVSIRLTVPFEEAPEEEGAGLVLEAMARGRVEAAVRRVGGRARVERTSRGLVISVTSSRAHVRELVEALRSGVGPPETGRLALIRARAAARTTAERTFETPRGALLASLRDRVLPDLPPVIVRPESIEALDAETVEAFWARTHRAERMSVVAAGPLDPAELARSLSGAGSGASGSGASPEGSRRAARPDPETLRVWYAQAWAAGSAEDPRGAVVAELATRRVGAEGRGTEVGVEIWEIGGRSVLVLAGAAYPARATALRRYVAGLLPAVEADLDDAEVRAVASAVRRDLLHRARDVEGMTTVVGRSLDSTGDPEAAWRFLESLERVDTTSLAEFLDEVLSRTPLRQELRP